MAQVAFGLFDWIDRGTAPLYQLYEERLQLLEAADAAGFFGDHLAEHHVTPLGMAPSPALFLTAAAQHIRRIRLGPLVYLLPVYHPLRLIEEVCMLDHLSGGRLELGVGRGVSPCELGYFGVNAADTRAIFTEALAILLAGLTHELNVRTYVHFDGVPGVWFFSLDASNTLAVLGARVAFGHPYFRARMRLQEAHAAIQFTSTRAHPGAPAARFEGTWARGEPLPSPPPDALDGFLVEGYCLYTLHWGGLSRVRIFHGPWPLRRVERLSFTSTMLESQGLPTPREAPLMHAQGEPLRVGIWAPERL